MDFPQEVWNVDTGQSGFLLPFIIGGLIMPVVESLKNTRLMDVTGIRPEFITGALCVGCAFLVECFVKTGAEPSAIIKNAFVSIGVATTMFGTHKVTKATKKKFKIFKK